MSRKAATEKPWSDCVVNLVGLVVFHGDFNYTVIWAKSKDGKNSGWVEVSGMWMERSDLGGADLMGRNIAALPGRGWGCSWHEHDREQCQEAGRAGGRGMTAAEQEEWYCTDREKRVRNTARMLVKREEVKSGTQRCKEGYHKDRTAELNASTVHPPSLAGTSQHRQGWTLNYLEGVFCPAWQQCLPLTARGASSS